MKNKVPSEKSYRHDLGSCKKVGGMDFYKHEQPEAKVDGITFKPAPAHYRTLASSAAINGPQAGLPQPTQIPGAKIEKQDY